MIIHPLPSETTSQIGATHICELGFADLTAASAAQTINIGPSAAKQAWTLILARLAQAFVSSDGTLISTTITVGDTGSAARFLASMELNAAGTTVFLKAGALAW